MTDNKDVHMSPETLEDLVGHPLRRSNDIKSYGDVTVTVGRLEQSIESTNVALRDFAQRTSNDVERLTNSIGELTRNQLMGKQTNWGMIASWAAVLVLLLGLVVYQPLQEIRTGINTHKQDGHPASVITRIEHNEDRFGEIADRLQREITLLEAADKERQAALASRVKETEDWILEHQSVSPKEHAILFEKTKDLKEDIDIVLPKMGTHESDIVSLKERILDIEREIYSGAAYRAGRPTKPFIPETK